MLRTRLYLRCLLYIVFIGYGWSERYCVYHKDAKVIYSTVESSDDENKDDDESMSIELKDSNNTQLCSDSVLYCYAVWKEDLQNRNSTLIMVQGCWEWDSVQDDCEQSECRAIRKRSKSTNHTKFCCCSGDFCNANITNDYLPSMGEDDDDSLKPPLQFVETAAYNKETIVIVLSSICAVVMISVLTFLIIKLCCTPRKPSPDSVHLMEAPLPTTPTFDLDSLKIQDVIGQGHYGSVCQGFLYNHTVAIKIFTVQNKQYFLNERDIYSLPFMDHPCLPKLIGSETRVGSDGKPEYLLVLTFAPFGSLHDYLVTNVIDWLTLCKMAQSITKALSHLHTEIKKGDKLKMCIAHRDLTSRNVLVKSDGSCMLCDFGFAIRVSGSKYYQNGERQTAETSSLADVGTLRYMAPEVLEGAVNLRDCESSLKQVDVYALGLVLWEIATRCSDLFQGMEVPDYRAPFEAEVGLHPTMEQMQVLVSRHKARPLFPDIWKDTNPAVRTLKETIDDCWDQDAEARLTALCAEERLSELMQLWERHKAGLVVPGVSPTVNPTSSGNSLGITTNGGISSSSSSQVTSDMSERYLSQGDIPNNMPPRSIERASSVSENTVETLLIMSPSESISLDLQYNNGSAMNMKNNLTSNSVNKCPRVTVPLQPHQGRNPCIERNLMMEPLEEVSVSGNMLLDRGLKFKEPTLVHNFSDHTNDNDLFQMADNTESNALVTSDVLSHSSRSYHPIPYVQNAVNLATTIPKQPNLPGNGHRLPLRTTEKIECKQKGKWWRPLAIFDKKALSNHGRKERFGIKIGLRNLLGKKSKSETHQTIESNNINMHQNTTSENSPIIKELYVNKLEKSREPIETEVCVVNKGPNSSSTTQTVIRRVTNTHHHHPQSSLVVAKSVDAGVTKKCPTNNMISSEWNRTETVQEIAENSIGNSVVIHKDINGNCSNDIPKRPTTLPIQGYEMKTSEQQHQCESSSSSSTRQENNPVVRRGGRQKITNRVKTPFEIKKGRFSLYDDSIMISESIQTKPIECSQLNCASKISLSLPLDIDTFCASQAEDFLKHQTGDRMT